MLAQNPSIPVPLWPRDDRAPASLSGNYVFWDSAAWQIVVVLPGALQGQPDAPSRVVRIPFKNRFEPQISATVSKQDETYIYNYAVQNGPAARDPIQSWGLAAPCDDALLTVNGEHCGGSGVRPPQAHTAQQVVLPHLKARGCYTRCFTEVPQAAGSPAARFQITSSYRPGLTTAAAANTPAFEVPKDWPDLLLEQLTKVGDPNWADMHVATIGPRFSANLPVNTIAADFRDSVNDLIQNGSLNPSSAFVSEARALFSRIAESGESGGGTISSRPGTKLEAEILQAAILSLGIRPAIQ